MMQHHQYSLTELDNMIPYEREIYVSLLMEYIKEENDRIKEEIETVKISLKIID